MGQQDVANCQAMLLDGREQVIDLVARIDDDPLAGVLAANHIAVLEERPDRPGLENHREPAIPPFSHSLVKTF